jgi:hypothetical protein
MMAWAESSFCERLLAVRRSLIFYADRPQNASPGRILFLAGRKSANLLLTPAGRRTAKKNKMYQALLRCIFIQKIEKISSEALRRKKVETALINYAAKFTIQRFPQEAVFASFSLKIADARSPALSIYSLPSNSASCRIVFTMILLCYSVK